MTNPQIFDELSSRMNKNKRPDSGIHNSMEMSGDHEQNRNRNVGDEQHDSGQESEHNDSTQKKTGVFRSFKKLFKRNKKKSRMDKLSRSQEQLSGQIKAQSEPDLLSHPIEQPQMHRYNSQVTKDDVNRLGVIGDDDDADLKNTEKKNSLKDAQQYIRSSLRKFKIKRKKSGGSDSSSSADVKPTDVKPTETIESKDFNLDSNESFFTKTITEVNETRLISPIDATFNLEDVSSNTHSAKVETSAARDKIRIAPKNRRKPARFRSPPPSTSHSSSLQQIKEGDSQPSSSRNSSRISGSKTSLYDPDERQRDSWEGKRTSSDVLPPKPSKRPANTSAENISYSKPLYGAQRSKSTNSRENVNATKSSKPRSENSSVNEINMSSDVRSHSFSLGELTSSNANENENNYHDAYSKTNNDKDNHPTNATQRRGSDSKETSRNNIYPSRSKENIYPKSRSSSSINENHSNENSHHNVVKASLEDIHSKSTNTAFRRSKEELFRNSKEDITDRMYKHDSLKKSIEDVSMSSKVESSDHSHVDPNSQNKRFSETTFALTSPQSDLELPPDFLSIRNNETDSNKGKDTTTSSASYIRNRSDPDKEINPQRSLAGKNCDTKNEIVLPMSKTSDEISDLGKSLKPSPKPKPVPSPRKPRKLIDNQEDVDSDKGKIPGFNRISLKRVPKTNDFLEKQAGGENKSLSESLDEPTKLYDFKQEDTAVRKSIKRPDAPLKPYDSKQEDSTFRKSVKSPDESDSKQTVAPRNSISPTEVQKSPEFKRLSLKRVPKMDDFLSKNQPSPSIDNDNHSDSSHASQDTRTNFELARQRSASVGKKEPIAPIKSVTEAKPFSFQSRDVLSSSSTSHRSMSLSNVEARRLRQNSTSPDDGERKVPEWIKIAKSKQLEEDEEVNDKENDPEAQMNVKPSALKSKINTTSDSALDLPSPPSSSRSLKLPNPPPISTSPRAAQSMKLQSDASKSQQCIVCSKTAYMFERVEVDNRTLHKNCAKCEICYRKLNVGGIYIHNDKVYCSQHK